MLELQNFQHARGYKHLLFCDKLLESRFYFKFRRSTKTVKENHELYCLEELSLHQGSIKLKRCIFNKISKYAYDSAWLVAAVLFYCLFGIILIIVYYNNCIGPSGRPCRTIVIKVVVKILQWRAE